MSKWIRRWLDELMGCDCDNGTRVDVVPPYHFDTYQCDRCVLVEVGGIRVRVKREHLMTLLFDNWGKPIQRPGVVLPAVEVADE